MKNILLLTDFSTNANHVAAYAYDFAKKIQANITLCNAVTIPSELPNAGLVLWPMESPEVIQDRSEVNLNKLRLHLQERDQSHIKKPQLTIVNQSGRLQDVVAEIISDRPIDLLAMGTHDNNNTDSFFKMDQARQMIDALQVPALIIPLKSKFEPIRSIYFASDLSDLPGDSVFLSQLVKLARSFMAEIAIVHISSAKADVAMKEQIYDMINDLRQELGYPGIHFREINGDNEVSTFEKLMTEKRMDLLVVVHREHGFFSRLLKGSVTKKLAGQLSIPMLIFNQAK
ncbi:universal stress protein [Pedobacter alluvionis]|uniref:Nucleotide-binding universal stress UspA family protein n=1 Tax=Pedobacter alluvionis TaxID=475253 RepID=A0A497XVA0_9SPHI|nr:universal stress protein [Pedobacter alluvionis]RLJ72544.1 nucleotide-binding universal stress UspA family protein [Pedobacter alluvionis]TFB28138.1 universal stress protein [Pedobacter alluvionis]